MMSNECHTYDLLQYWWYFTDSQYSIRFELIVYCFITLLP